ncbi:hypothetical protein [Nocardia sp. NPDC127526]|uniref:hypothetical protein n=1 Tax=Nocardia sp. NPDC127526 TaxID=3345393 RepID=UPI00362F87C5
MTGQQHDRTEPPADPQPQPDVSPPVPGGGDSPWRAWLRRTVYALLGAVVLGVAGELGAQLVDWWLSTR